MDSRDSVAPVEWRSGAIRLVDQTKLPHELVFKETRDYRDVADSIRRLEVRGAPAIGVAAAMGVALAGLESRAEEPDLLRKDVQAAADLLVSTRPTAVNLRWAVDRMLGVLRDPSTTNASEVRKRMVDEALAILEEDRVLSRRIGENGASLLEDGDRVLTHCNAGGLATSGYGTALAVVYTAVEQGKCIRVFADETRPLLQGARLTTWELLRHGIDVTLLCDGAAASAMAEGLITKVIVGADRIARNGDVANKIGTLGVALAAARYGVPFYVAAPYSTIDASIGSGGDIPIEQREGEEVTTFAGVPVAPAGVGTYNPAFDVTPAEFVGAIVTDAGVHRAPYEKSLSAAAG